MDKRTPDFEVVVTPPFMWEDMGHYTLLQDGDPIDTSDSAIELRELAYLLLGKMETAKQVTEQVKQYQALDYDFKPNFKEQA